MLWVVSWWEQSSLQIGREWQACPDTLWEEYWHLETALESAWTQWFGELPSLMARCGWSLLLIFISLWVLVLDHLLNYSRKVTHRCRCPLQTVVCMLTLIFVLLCYFIWFTWIALLCLPPSCSRYFDWRVMLSDVFFSMQITDSFLFCHEAGYGGWCSRSLILPLPWPWGTA